MNFLPRFSRSLAASALLLAIAAGLPGASAARERRKPANAADEKPVVIINVASFERLLNHAVAAFEQGGRPELAESLGSGLAKFNDLKGYDRQQSVGMMLFVNNILTERLKGSDKPMVTVVSYFPIKNLDEMIKTIQAGAAVANKVGENLYEITGGRQKLHVLVKGDYAFVADRRDSLDRDLGNPAVFSRALSTAYDVGVSVNLNSLSQTTRDFIGTALRGQAENDLQRRDGESAAAHRLRHAAGMQRLEFLEQILTQGEKLTLGWSLSEAEKTSAIEVVVVAKPDSDFARALNDLRGTRTHFENLLAGKPAAGLSVSLKLDKGNRKLLQQMLSSVELAGLPPKAKGKAPVEPAPVAEDELTASARELIKTLTNTIDHGHIDAVAQFVGKPQGPFVLVGGIKLVDADLAVVPLRDFLANLKKNPNIKLGDAPLNAFTHAGIEFQRIKLADSREAEKRVYGEDSSLYLGIGKSVLWFALGGNDAQDAMKKAIDAVSEPVQNPTQAAPLQFVMNLSDWMDVFDPKQRSANARKAFTEGKDAVRVEVLGITNGIRLRARFDEGFTTFVGLGMVQREEVALQRREAAEAAKKKAAEEKQAADSKSDADKKE